MREVVKDVRTWIMSNPNSFYLNNISWDSYLD